VEAGSALEGRQLRHLPELEIEGVLVLALHIDDDWTFNSDGSALLEPQTRMVFISDTATRTRLERLASG
jgi:uncharacterized protein with PhoU and TrkA domain